MNARLVRLVWLVCTLATLVVIADATRARAATPLYFWSESFGSVNTENCFAVAVDGSGNIFITGFFSGTVDFGGGGLVSAGGLDVFLAKYNSSGVHQWSQQLGGTDTDAGYALAIDGSGNVLLAGNFRGTATFGGGNLVSAGNDDVFLAKYNASGVHQWSKRFGSTGNDDLNAVAVDASGNVVLAGSFQLTVDFGGGGLASAGAGDAFLAKYNASGTHQWSKRFGSTSGDWGEDVAVDASGNVVLTGSFQGTVDFGGGGLASAGSVDMFLARYTSGGVHQWSQRFGGTGIDNGISVSVDASGNAVLTGHFQNTVDFGGGGLISAGSYDIFLAMYDAGGVHQWSKRFGNTGVDQSYAVSVDGSGQVNATGSFQGTVDFGGGGLVTAGIEDIFLIRYNTSGAYQWSRRFGSTLADVGRAVSADGSGGVVATGTFQGTVDFGGGGLISAGSTDIFMLRYGPNAEPQILSIVDVGNDEGRQVKIRFARSGLDDPTSGTPIQQYEAYRRSDELPFAVEPPFAARFAPGASGALAIPGWAFVGAAPAHGEIEYEMLAPTLADSTIAQGQYLSAFFIRAATTTPSVFYDSPLDSGYSLDNIAPAMVLGSLTYDAGVLGWDASTAEDLDYYAVYGSNTNEFSPSLASSPLASNAASFAAATLIDYTVAPTLDVTASPYTYYFVTATDFAGNEGPPAVVNTLTGAGGPPASYVLSVSAYPNPFNPSTTVRYTVPSRGRVTIAIYDARGARVATLVDEEKPAGAFTVGWNGREQGGGAVSSGVYFARIEMGGADRAYKLVLVK